jgi:3-deoxy-manno-octulosonate cytidylyltransferase (CMP-KDO synthetase)
VPVLGVIPARLGSSRLPRKPLLPLGGEPLVIVVTRRIAELGICDRLVVATDAKEIANVVTEAGFEAVMTSPDHSSGTERVAEVIAQAPFSGFNYILNIQGDEPFVAAAAVRGALACLEGGEPLGTAAGSLDRAFVNDPSRVKVVVDARGRAVYFSRAPIPFDRDGTGDVIYHQHVGVYGYTREALEAWVRLPPVPEEQWERLEQLRPLLHGIPMGVTSFDGPAAPGIDTPADLKWAEAEITRHLREVSS